MAAAMVATASKVGIQSYYASWQHCYGGFQNPGLTRTIRYAGSGHEDPRAEFNHQGSFLGAVP